MEEKYCLIITSYADEKNGKKIINTLLTARLAACIQVMPIQSYYHWQGKITSDDEKLLFIKTKSSLLIMPMSCLRLFRYLSQQDLINIWLGLTKNAAKLT